MIVQYSDAILSCTKVSVIWAHPFKTYLRSTTPNKGDITSPWEMSTKLSRSLQSYHVDLS